jgi:hypothetical protein
LARQFFPRPATAERRKKYVKTKSGVLAAVISVSLALGAAAEQQPGEKVDVKSLPCAVQQELNGVASF